MATLWWHCSDMQDMTRKKPGQTWPAHPAPCSSPLPGSHAGLHTKAPMLWLCRQRHPWGSSQGSDLGGVTSSVQETTPAWMSGKASQVAPHPSWNWLQGREQQVATE